jgi:hypothetical protein
VIPEAPRRRFPPPLEHPEPDDQLPHAILIRLRHVEGAEEAHASGNT